MTPTQIYLYRLRNDVKNAEIAFERQKRINDRKRVQYWDRAVRADEAAKKQQRDINRLSRYERALIEARQTLASFEKTLARSESVGSKEPSLREHVEEAIAEAAKEP